MRMDYIHHAAVICEHGENIFLGGRMANYITLYLGFMLLYAPVFATNATINYFSDFTVSSMLCQFPHDARIILSMLIFKPNR